MISGGVLINCDVTVEDIDRALSIYGKPVGLIKGKHHVYLRDCIHSNIGITTKLAYDHED